MSTISSIPENNPFNDALIAGAQGAAFGSIFGGLGQGVISHKEGNSFWTGKKPPIPPIQPTIELPELEPTINTPETPHPVPIDNIQNDFSIYAQIENRYSFNTERLSSRNSSSPSEISSPVSVAAEVWRRTWRSPNWKSCEGRRRRDDISDDTRGSRLRTPCSILT